MSEHPEVYLGDGLYASFNGWEVILRAPREGGDHFVALDPQVVGAFHGYLEHLDRKYPGHFPKGHAA